MKANEVAAELLKTPGAFVLLKDGNRWVEATGVSATGEHRNAVTLDGLPGNEMLSEPTILGFRMQDIAKWNAVDVPIPHPGDFLASDGVDTWVIRRENPGPIGGHHSVSRVKWWREISVR